MKPKGMTRKAWIIAIMTITGAVVVALIINLLFKLQSGDFFAAEWEPGDALGYAGSILGAVGTIFLGYVACEQNDRLHDLERSNYIANNSGMLLVNEVAIKHKAAIPVNWDGHSEQIIVDTKNTSDDLMSVGYDFTFTASIVGSSIPSLIYVESCNIFCEDDAGQTSPVSLFGKNYLKKYSRIAICKDGVIKFRMTYVVSEKLRRNFEEAIKQQGYAATVQIFCNIVTDKGVSTKCQCRARSLGTTSEYDTRWVAKNPLVFFLGHDIVDMENIQISGEEQDKCPTNLN